MNERIVSLAKYKVDITVFIFLVLSLITRFLYVLPDMDEIWNYQYARRILYGYLPYRDFLMEQTPLLAQINAALLYIFQDELIYLRIIALLIASLLGFILFLILRYIGNNELISFIFICAFVSVVFLYPYINYSWFVLLFISLALYFELVKTNKMDYKKLILIEFIIGIILGLATITKQNIGIAGIIVSFALTLYYCSNIKNFAYSMFAKILGLVLVVGLEILYFLKNDSAFNFYESTLLYPILSAKNISVPYYKLLLNYSLTYKILALIIPFILLFLFFKYLKEKRSKIKNFILIILAYSIVNFVMAFPVSDPVHLILSSPIPIVGFSLLINKKTSQNKNELHLSKFYRFIFITMICFLFLGLLLNAKNNYNLNVNHYKYIHVPKNLAIKLYEIDDYILSKKQDGKQIFFLDFRSSFYLIPLNIFNFKSDCMTSSEYGSKWDKEIIQKISDSEDIIVLIRNKDSNPNRRDSGYTFEYVKNNMFYLKSIQEFDVYTK